MSAVASGLSFEVLRFTVEPVSPDVALLELEGRFRADTRRRLGVPRLVAEGADGSREVLPAAAGDAQAEPDGGALWRASYAIDLELLEDGDFSLAVGRQLLLALPAPDPAEGTGEREVRLAREANALRRTSDEARAAAGAALASAGSEREAREAAEAQVAEARMARDDHARRASSLDDELAAVRRDHAAELVRRDEELRAALAGRDEETARAADERVAEIEAEAAEARRALRAARAEAEAMRRDLERERERAEAAEASVRRGRVTAVDDEPIDGLSELEGEPPAEGPTTVAEPHEEGPTTVAEPDADSLDGEHPTTVAGADGEQALAAARAEAHGPTYEDPSLDDITWDKPAEDPTDVAAREPGAIEGSPGETVRVLGARRPRRTGEGTPADAAPGTAAIGARHIEPGQTHRSAAAEWLTRALAFAALAIVVLALLLVIKPF
jgi:hypothetical protein